MKLHRLAFAWMLFAVSRFATAAPVEVATTGIQPVAGSSHAIVSGTIVLPGDGYWTLSPLQASNTPVEVYLMPPEEIMTRPVGRRMRQVEETRAINAGRGNVQSLYWVCREFAETNHYRGPASIEALLASNQLAHIQRSPWSGVHAQEKGPFVCLVPNVTFRFAAEGTNPVPRQSLRVPFAQRDVLAFELRPFVDDGKHWVVYTDGSCERMPIDAVLVAKLGQPIKTVTQVAAPEPSSPTAVYTMMMVRTPATPDTITLSIENRLAGGACSATWKKTAAPVQKGLKSDLQKMRVGHWRYLAATTQSGILAGWAGLSMDDEPFRGGRRGAASATSVFGMLGGRAAIDETLQLQALRSAPDAGGPTIGIGAIPGVTVKSHPYAEMLGDTRVSPPAILKTVPADRVALHVLRPASLLAFLDGGADFISGLGSAATGRSIRYDLKKRYLARMGLNEAWMRQILKSGVVTEIALHAPDLFFIDGTDITVIARVSQPAALAGLLARVGVTGLTGDATAVPNGQGRETFWALRGDLLIISTSRRELDLTLALHKDPAASLAESAEYRYMLAQLPVQDRTRMMIYFSDPFIRRLVGPAVKIGQLRRASARSRMEHVTAAALLANLDGIQAPTLDQLREAGALPEAAAPGDLQLKPDGRAVSAVYGSLADPTPLSEIPLAQVTKAEADDYARYLENYNRFWRQFFDPIAIRIDDTPDGGLEMTTFILPLIDNSLYNGMKEFLVTRQGPPLNVPRPKPDPVLMLSLNLGEPAWTQVSEGLSELFTRFSHLSPAVLDDLGPALHFALYDADPVIALGSGDLFGAFGGGVESMDRGEAFMVPMALSLLTRPCAFIIETRDSARTTRFLEEAASASLATRRGGGRGSDEFSAEFYRVADENAWVYSFSVMGLIKIRFGIRVEGNYVVVRNIPWSSRDVIAGVAESPMRTARLLANPSACREQMAGLYSAAMEHERSAAMQGIGRLYPLMLARGLTPEAALAEHQRLFGFRPAHPGGGAWTGTPAARLRSTTFGSPDRQEQPAFGDATAPFGLFKSIDSLNVSMEFQDEGLRTVLQWKTKL
jgi:hypothetical protein